MFANVLRVLRVCCGVGATLYIFNINDLGYLLRMLRGLRKCVKKCCGVAGSLISLYLLIINNKDFFPATFSIFEFFFIFLPAQPPQHPQQIAVSHVIRGLDLLRGRRNNPQQKAKYAH